MMNRKVTRTSESDQASRSAEDHAQTVEVLYQKLGERWYAFSLFGKDRVLVGSIPQQVMEGLLAESEHSTLRSTKAIESQVDSQLFRRRSL